MSEFDIKCEYELRMRENIINTEYPIIFNRINWDKIEDEMMNLVKFQKQTNTIIPYLFHPVNLNDKYDEFWNYLNQITWDDDLLFLEHQLYLNSNKRYTYDEVYEFITENPQWEDLVYYQKDPNLIYDDFLEEMSGNYPFRFNHINWKYIDSIIDDLYNYQIGEDKPLIPWLIFMKEPENMSQNYYNKAYKIFEYYEKKEDEGCLEFQDYYNNVSENSYDKFYEFIKQHPQWSKIVYRD